MEPVASTGTNVVYDMSYYYGSVYSSWELIMDHFVLCWKVMLPVDSILSFFVFFFFSSVSVVAAVVESAR